MVHTIFSSSLCARSDEHFHAVHGYWNMRTVLILLASAWTLTSCQAQSPSTAMENQLPVQKSEEAWLQELGPERYRILRQRERNTLELGNTTSTLNPVRTVAQAAEPLCSPRMASLTHIADGPVLTKK